MSHENDQQLFSGNAEYIESLYEQFLADPASVSEHWQGYFQNLDISVWSVLIGAWDIARRI